MLFIAPDTLTIRDQAKLLYPAVRREAFVHQTKTPILHMYTIPRAVIESVQGLDGHYLPLADRNADPLTVVDPAIDLSWGETPPLAYPFEVMWAGSLLAPSYGVYTLRVETPGRVHLTLDNRTVIVGSGAQSRQIVLAQGVHRLALDCRVDEASSVRLLWQKPGDETLSPVPPDMLYRAAWPVNGLVGRFYANDNWEGDPVMARIDRQVAYYFHYLPQPRPYTVEWSGRLSTSISGTYSFSVKAVSSVSLYIDGEPVVENSELGQIESGSVVLSIGMHDIDVRFLDQDSHSQVYLYWMPPGEDYTRIPSEALYLPLEGAWWPLE
jgi:hypothetical protein